MKFELVHTDSSSQARAGTIHTGHGLIQTPVFVPVGTVGTVKGVWPLELESVIGSQVILSNTYHLYLRPGTDIIQKAGGLHPFMQWKGPILTDSGGYQVFSLASRRTISEEGAEFQSHIDGSTHQFTPESVIDIQRAIGSDIMMVLDECPAGSVTEDYATSSNELTLRWAARCKKRAEETIPNYGHSQALFGIVQGVVYPDVRRDSARALVDLDFPGYAIGGLSVGEPAEEMYAMVEVVNEILPLDKPRYLMGVGTPANLVENVGRGVDMFDCVIPTRNGRNGMLFTTEGIINIRNRKWRDDVTPIDPGLSGGVSHGFSKAYLRHLFIAGELLGLQMASVHNLTFYTWLMKEARSAALEDRYNAWKKGVLPKIERRL
ncbi:MAG: tRNA guanosine(34) transglycosylase Tgt [Rhodothermia bacterium]|nr:MAG: tRNA guanosine(34) transglycosylase Tgt [Rhodothermia bacterium]